MPDEGPRGGFSIATPSHSYWWPGALCLPRDRFGLVRLVCLFALFALLVSAISPVDDLLQPDFSRHSNSWHRTVTASKLLHQNHLPRRNWAAAAITFGAHAGPVRHPADDSIYDLPAPLSSPGFEHSLAARAPPTCSSYN